MGFVIIIVLLVLLWAYRAGRPMKLVLTPEEAKVIKANWWAAARAELKIWAIFFALGFAIVGHSLASAHWQWPIYAMIVLASLQIFSRLIIWATFGLWVVAWTLGLIAEVLGYHTLFNPLYIMVPLTGAIIAIVIRFWFFWACSSGQRVAPTEPRLEERGHTCCAVFQRAGIRPPN